MTSLGILVHFFFLILHLLFSVILVISFAITWPPTWQTQTSIRSLALQTNFTITFHIIYRYTQFYINFNFIFIFSHIQKYFWYFSYVLVALSSNFKVILPEFSISVIFITELILYFIISLIPFPYILTEKLENEEFLIHEL